jgi:hypothetical protein
LEGLETIEAPPGYRNERAQDCEHQGQGKSEWQPEPTPHRQPISRSARIGSEHASRNHLLTSMPFTFRLVHRPLESCRHGASFDRIANRVPPMKEDL